MYELIRTLVFCLLLLGVLGVLADVCYTGWWLLRRVGEGQCGFCGYSTVGLPTPICPECGQDHTAVRRRPAYKRFIALLFGVCVWTVGMLLLTETILWTVCPWDGQWVGWYSFDQGGPPPVTKDDLPPPLIVAREWQVYWPYLVTGARPNPTHVYLSVKWDAPPNSLRVSVPDLRLADGRVLTPAIAEEWLRGTGTDLDADPNWPGRCAAAVDFLQANGDTLSRPRVVRFGQWRAAGRISSPGYPTNASLAIVFPSVLIVWAVAVLLFCRHQRRVGDLAASR